MPREIHADTLAQLTASVTFPRYFFEVELVDDSTLRYWTGEKDISWGGHTWLGNGFLKDPGQISESQESRFGGLEVELCGEPSALISTMLSQLQRGRPGSLYFGFVTASNVVVDVPVQWTGELDSVQFNDGVDEATITLKFESDLARGEKGVDRRFNHESQLIDYPSDLGFEYVEQMQNYSGYWGRPNPTKKGSRQRKDRQGYKRGARR